MSASTMTSDKVWQGLAVSGGVADAVVHVLQDSFDEPPTVSITPEQAEAELTRLDEALHATKEEVRGLQKLTGEPEIFETHLLLLDDVSVLDYVRRTVKARLLSVDAVYFKLMRKHMNALRGVDDPYLRERFIDIKDVTQRVMRHLRGEDRAELSFEQPVIIVAHDLTPSDTVQVDREMVVGFAVETGSTNSHAAIIARSLGIPAVVRLHGLCGAVHTGERVVLDGNEGLLVQHPCDETLARYRQKEAEDLALDDKLHALCHQPAVTSDGRTIRIGANAEFLDELDAMADCGAEEVGLFRTEFIYLEDPDADEDQLTSWYCDVVTKLSPRRIIFRTLDLGGDKLDPLLATEPEPNPFLGWRGIRASLAQPETFKRQLRSILRASAHGEVGIMFPMISGVGEVREAKELLEACKQEVRREGIAIAPHIEVGAMIEIPSAACTADLIAPEVDFFSLGTNDLIQYTIAVDRLNERVSELYQSAHPGVLRLIRMVVAAARKHDVKVAMCGEMAGDLELMPLVIGLGLEELSASMGQVPSVKEAIRKLNFAECEALAEQVLEMADPAEIYRLSLEVAERCYADLLH